MIILIAAIALAATPPAEPPCCLRPQAIVMEESDSKETRHAIGHVIGPAVLTMGVYGGAMYLGADRKQARILSVAASLAAIIGKELYDHSTEAKAFSKLDVALGLGGTAVGIWAAEAIEWRDEHHEMPRE